MMYTKKKLQGIIPAIITPIAEDGKLDLKLLEKQEEYLIKGGVQGLFVCGGTGEGAYLKTEEKKKIFQAVKEQAEGRVFMCAALINSNTRAVLEEMRRIAFVEPEYIVVTAPYYHSVTQKDILTHYQKIAEEAPAPVIVYNIPSATHNNIEAETAQQLSEMENIAGIKDSSGNFINFTRGLFENKNKNFSWIQGEDYLCGASFLVGAEGVVSGLSNVRIEPYIEMYQAALIGDRKKVQECQSRINRLYKIIHLFGNGNAAIKAATEVYGRGSRWMQIKSMSLNDAQIKMIHKILDEYENWGMAYGEKI